ncbi:MAG: hypothetical protein KDK36_16760, partial [Leptospiraceae bacterium]|nr:hypothetical protein [Leptospiraceae bacterium]
RLVSVQTGNIVSIASQLIPLNKGILDLFQKVKKENGKVGYDSEVKILRKTYSGYQKPKKYLLDDEVVLTYHHSNKFGTAKVGLMKRSCNENSVEFIRFLDVKEDSKELIFPFESTISLRNLLSDYGNVKMDDSGCYELSLMVEGKKMKNTLISIEPGARKDVLED